MNIHAESVVMHEMPASPASLLGRFANLLNVTGRHLEDKTDVVERRISQPPRKTNHLFPLILPDTLIRLLFSACHRRSPVDP